MDLLACNEIKVHDSSDSGAVRGSLTELNIRINLLIEQGQTAFKYSARRDRISNLI